MPVEDRFDSIYQFIRKGVAMAATKFTEFFEKQNKVLGHPSALYTLFFTEMWERFSYYGMRVIFVLFLITGLDATVIDQVTGNEIANPGWGWTKKEAMLLYALYTGLVYFAPIIGGVIADKILGNRVAVLIGGLVMAGGHLCMGLGDIHALDAFKEVAMYMGLGLLIVGNGFFKPNISSMVGQLYADDVKKDGAYTIFYMGINAGAFLGITLCGYIGEKFSWTYGFGLATIFMLAGSFQFMFAKKLFGGLGDKPVHSKDATAEIFADNKSNQKNQRLLTWVGIGAALAVGVWLAGKGITGLHKTDSTLSIINTILMPSFIIGAVTAIIGFIMSDPKLTKVEFQRIIAILIFTLFTIVFFWAFEQAGGSMTIFAKDYTNRVISGQSALLFKIINSLIHLGAMGMITFVLYKLFVASFNEIPISSLILGFLFAGVWCLIGWVLYREFTVDTNEVTASWFQILNSFFIITFAPLFTKVWDTGFLKAGPHKYALGLILMGVGFSALAMGASGIEVGAKTASVSMIWLIIAYFFHTLGELSLSPVGLTYVSKLAPTRMISLMFGVFFIAYFIASWLAGMTGSVMDGIVAEKGISYFFWIFAIIPFASAFLLVLAKGPITKLMNGIE